MSKDKSARAEPEDDAMMKKTTRCAQQSTFQRWTGHLFDAEIDREGVLVSIHPFVSRSYSATYNTHTQKTHAEHKPHHLLHMWLMMVPMRWVDGVRGWRSNQSDSQSMVEEWRLARMMMSSYAACVLCP